MLEIVWFGIAFCISAIILLTDPKPPLSGGQENGSVAFLKNTSSTKNFVEQSNYYLIAAFLIICIVLNISQF